MPWLVGLIVGPVLVAFLAKTLGQALVRTRAEALRQQLHAFQRATDDDERQRLILEAGRSLLISSAMVGMPLLVSLGVLAVLPWALAWSTSENFDHLLSASLSGTACALWMRHRAP